jgi:uncharacterized protein YdiU (UPF0061 family)
LHFDNSYAGLPPAFYSATDPTPVHAATAIRMNTPLAQRLGIDPQWLASTEAVEVIAGNAIPEGAEPIATAYAGHQFGHYNPQLGDGRAVLLGELIAPDGARFDLQLKGSGPTPYSRGGDGRSPLGPVLREYLVSEAMAALGVPTTRALGAVSTGEPVYREQALPGAVLARVAASHLRIGTVQFIAARGDQALLQQLVHYALQRHYPEHGDSDNPALALLQTVQGRIAELVARWQLLGFIHGVMNTDNMLLSGETVDYGPCAYMDNFHPDTVFSSIDHGGRYAYRNQPGIAHWNLAVLAQALLPLLHPDTDAAVALAQGVVDEFPAHYSAAYHRGLGDKLGIAWQESDAELVEDLFTLMTDTKADFTLTFRRLAELAGPPLAADTSVSAHWELPTEFTPWLTRWRQRLVSETRDAAQRQRAMLATNPAIIARNHLVEAAITAGNDGDLSVFEHLTARLEHPFEYGPGDWQWARPPAPEEAVRQTFCGT